LSGANPNGITQNFTVTVSGPNSYSQVLTFHMVNGVVSDSPQSLSGLIPGVYTVAETNPGPNWSYSVSNGGSVTVQPDGAPDTSTVTNTFVPGSLTVTKVMIIPDGVALNGINDDFTVTVTGPNSYTNSHIFHVVNGVLQAPASFTLTGLVAGTYHVSETAGVLWNAVVSGVSGNVQVVPGGTATSTVTNTHARPHTSASLRLSSPILDATGGTVTVTVTDTNDGDVPLFNSHMHLAISPIPAGMADPQGIQGETGFYFLGNDKDNLTAPFNFVEIGTFVGESMSNDGIMEVNETWTWTVTVHVTKTTQFDVRGNGYDPAGGYANYPAIPSERATGQVTVSPPVPATSGLGIGLMIAGIAGAMLYLVRRKARRQSITR
jgi:hypothetical protein